MLKLNSRMTGSKAFEPISVALLGLGLVFVYSKIFLPYLPNEAGRMGNDWSYVLPSLLNGFYWYTENGAFSIPWFTAAKCGGYAFYATDSYYSLGGILSWFISPLHSVQVTFLIFSVLGYCGLYLFMRNILNASIAASLLAATLFMFNGFSSHRMLVGHYAFHGFLLTPLLAFILTTKIRTLHMQLAQIAGVGLLFAYMVHAAMTQIIPPTILALILLLLLQSARYSCYAQPWWLLGLGGLGGVAIASSKLIAFTSLMGQFPRTYYPLPGIDNFLLLLKTILIGFFFPVPNDIGNPIVNSAFSMARHEWEFGLSPIPLFLFITTGLMIVLRSRSWTNLTRGLSRHQSLSIIGIVIIATIPILLNFHVPQWNAFLKELPFINASSSLVRWLVMEIPLLCCLSGLALDYLAKTLSPEETYETGWGLCIAGVLGVLLYNGLADQSFYNQGYSSIPVERAWIEAHQSGTPPPITQVAVQVGGNGPNDGLTIGVTSMHCYEPTMGYRLEKFPMAPLSHGTVFPAQGEWINLKNPSCYSYPKENQCKAGDHFTMSQRGLAEALIHYQPFEFTFSKHQELANLVSFCSLILALGVLTFALLCKAFHP